MRKGFTLIEMSVVLVVIGLLVAGIILAQSLVRSSRVQTMITDVATFRNAMTQFKQKYGVVAGDMSNATAYWGTNPHCSTAGGLGTGTQTCNGNGDGQVTYPTTAVPPFENFLVWQHLANGGFIPGQYTGTSSSTAAYTYYCQPGVNCPGGSINSQQAYYLVYLAAPIGSPNYWAQPAGHYLFVGESVTQANYPAYPLVTAAEAQSLDSKVDDGLPGMGVWKSWQSSGTYDPKCAVISGTSNAPTDGTIASEATAVYNVKYGTTPACSFIINLNF